MTSSLAAVEDAFPIVEEPLPLPPGVERVDIQQSYEELLVRYSAAQDMVDTIQQEHEKQQRRFLLDLLSVLDALDRILIQPSFQGTDQASARQQKAIESTRRLMVKKLADARVTRIETEGRPLDSRHADVLDVEERQDVPEETVLQEIVAGYQWGDQILRRASVIVSMPPNRAP